MTTELQDILIQLSDYFEDFRDINDDGGPNQAMRFKQDIDNFLEDEKSVKTLNECKYIIAKKYGYGSVEVGKIPLSNLIIIFDEAAELYKSPRQTSQPTTNNGKMKYLLIDYGMIEHNPDALNAYQVLCFEEAVMTEEKSIEKFKVCFDAGRQRGVWQAQSISDELPEPPKFEKIIEDESF